MKKFYILYTNEFFDVEGRRSGWVIDEYIYATVEEIERYIAEEQQNRKVHQWWIKYVRDRETNEIMFKYEELNIKEL